jgi:hypothetical protein
VVTISPDSSTTGRRDMAISSPDAHVVLRQDAPGESTTLKRSSHHRDDRSWNLLHDECGATAPTFSETNFRMVDRRRREDRILSSAKMPPMEKYLFCNFKRL